MALIIHILIALGSIAVATAAYFYPSQSKLSLSYGLVAATLASGSYLVLANPAHMVQACTTGLIYLGAVSVAIISAHRKLAD